MRNCIVLNILDLTSTKRKILNSFFTEYLKILNTTMGSLPDAKSSTDLHHLTYSDIRKTSFLPSDIVQEARKDVWAKRKTITRFFKNCSIRLNKRWFRFIKSERENPCFKITYSPRKSFVIPIKLDRQTQRFNSFLSDGWRFDNITLLRDGKIAVVLEKEFPKPEDNGRFIVGVDIGSSTLAAITVFDTKTSKVVRQLYFGRDITLRQSRYLERKAILQSHVDKGSEKAVKYMKRLKHKQRNFVKTRSGQIAKQIVNLAIEYNASIAIERLKNIRGKRSKFNRTANRKINRIPYAKLNEFLSSNAEMFQISLHEVDPYHTSKWCPRCGAVNPGHQSSNYALYKCKCGLIVNSDRKASLAVAVKSLLERTTHDFTKSSSVQISKSRVPVNGLFRPDAVGNLRSVNHDYQPMESHRF